MGGDITSKMQGKIVNPTTLCTIPPTPPKTTSAANGQGYDLHSDGENAVMQHKTPNPPTLVKKLITKLVCLVISF